MIGTDQKQSEVLIFYQDNMNNNYTGISSIFTRFDTMWLFFFQKIKSVLKETCFESVDAVKNKIADV